MVALVTLFHLLHRQVWMQPVKLIRLQVLQEETVASNVLDVRSQSAADEDRADDGLQETEPDPVIKHRKGRVTGFYVLGLTLTCQELSHFTSLKFLPKLLLVQKQTLRILTASLSTVKCDSGVASLCLGLGTFQDKVSPDITSYMVRVGSAPSYLRHSVKRQRKSSCNRHLCTQTRRFRCRSTAVKQRNSTDTHIT